MGELKTFHLFAGAGGGIFADLLLGHIPVGAVEIEKYPREVLLARQKDRILPAFPIWDDIRTFRKDNKECKGFIKELQGIREELIITGGFPCQDISVAGKGAGIDGERSGLWSEMFRVVCEVRPEWVYMENSPALTYRGLGRVLGNLAEGGYDAEWIVLGADDVGAPHRRKRIWILAHSRLFEGRACRQRSLTKDGRGEHEETKRSTDTAETPRPSKTPRVMAHANSLHAQGEFPCGADTQRRQEPGERQAGPCGFASNDWWEQDPADGPVESRVDRMANGVAHRMDRIKAIGNGQVPLVASVVFRELKRRFESEGN